MVLVEFVQFCYVRFYLPFERPPSNRLSIHIQAFTNSRSIPGQVVVYCFAAQNVGASRLLGWCLQGRNQKAPNAVTKTPRSAEVLRLPCQRNVQQTVHV